MQGIVPEKHQRRIFDQLIQSGLDLVIKEGEVCLHCAFCTHITSLLVIFYLYHISGLMLIAVRPFQLIAPLCRFLSGTQELMQTISNVYLKYICSLDTSASSMLGVHDDYCTI